MSTPLKGPILSSLVLALLGWEATSEAAVQCQRTLVANVVALDQPLMFNRLGAQNANGMMFALREDVVDDKHIVVGNDNNLPFSSSRDPNKADDNELVLLQVEALLKAR